MQEKLPEPTDSKSSFTYTIQKRDVDTNHHVNNLNYLDYASEALPISSDFSQVEIMYKHEAKLGDIINCSYSKLNDNEYIVVIKNFDLSLTHAIIRVKN